MRPPDRTARSLCGDGLSARPPQARAALPSRELPQLPDRLRHPLGLADAAGCAGARGASDRRLGTAHSRGVGQSPRQELPLGRHDARAVRSARRRRRYLRTARCRGQRDRGARLQHIRRRQRRGDDARSRRARGHHPDVRHRALRRTRHSLRGASAQRGRTARCRRDLSRHHGRRHHAGLAHRRPNAGQRPPRPDRLRAARSSGPSAPKAGTRRRSTTKRC